MQTPHLTSQGYSHYTIFFWIFSLVKWKYPTRLILYVSFGTCTLKKINYLYQFSIHNMLRLKYHRTSFIICPCILTTTLINKITLEKIIMLYWYYNMTNNLRQKYSKWDIIWDKGKNIFSMSINNTQKRCHYSCLWFNLLASQLFIWFSDEQAEADGSNEYNNFQPGSLNTTNQIIQDLKDIDVVFHIGDLCYANGYLSQWDQFTAQIEPIASKVPYMTARFVMLHIHWF